MQSAAELKKHPNLLFILSDQHRFCDLGCYGNKIVQTPTLDSVAEQGILLERMYSNCPLCVPARGTLLTGKYPLRHGALTNDILIRPDTESMADILGRNGYHCGYVGKWHLGGVPRERCIPPEERLGFDYWRACNCNHAYYNAWYDDGENRRHTVTGYEPHAQTDLALEFLRQPGEKPWALFISYGTPHNPYDQVPSETIDCYRAADIPLRENVQTPVTLSRGLPGGDLNEVKAWTAGYYAHIEELDRQVARLLNGLGERRDNTIVVYTSDHGDMLGSQGFKDKQLPYEEAVHIPFILSWGERLPPGPRRGLMGLVDVAPTLLGLLGLSYENMDGQDLRGMLIDPEKSGREGIYMAEYVPAHEARLRGSPEWRALRTERWLFAKTPYDACWLLFDMEADPFQRRNLAEDPAFSGIVRELDGQINAEISRHDALLPWPEFLRRYGFTDLWNKSQAYFELPLLDFA